LYNHFSSIQSIFNNGSVQRDINTAAAMTFSKKEEKISMLLLL